MEYKEVSLEVKMFNDLLRNSCYYLLVLFNLRLFYKQSQDQQHSKSADP
jgi:hypothetical protein